MKATLFAVGFCEAALRGKRFLLCPLASSASSVSAFCPRSTGTMLVRRRIMVFDEPGHHLHDGAQWASRPLVLSGHVCLNCQEIPAYLAARFGHRLAQPRRIELCPISPQRVQNASQFARQRHDRHAFTTSLGDAQRPPL